MRPLEFVQTFVGQLLRGAQTLESCAWLVETSHCRSVSFKSAIRSSALRAGVDCVWGQVRRRALPGLMDGQMLGPGRWLAILWRLKLEWSANSEGPAVCLGP